VQIPKRSSGETVQPKTQLGTDNRDSESIFGKLGEKSGLEGSDASGGRTEKGERQNHIFSKRSASSLPR